MKSSPIENEKKTVDIMDAIYNRRAVRNYLPTQVNSDLIHILLDAAMQAPTALHEEPRAFAVIQNKELLNRLSDSCKAELLNETDKLASEQRKRVLGVVKQKDFNVFYNAGTLIVIYSTYPGPFVTAECWLAAENLMLAAYGKGLGSCVIGFSLAALNLPEWKQELGVPADMIPQAAIIIGWPAEKPLAPSHNSPTILSWK
ncbi:nitroreductase family protein [Legionella maioricensis]|uniref:Nitroreductase family protein n=1 Tax=Legionella maioricensis TaxID=2896528 RepID=A0A9X2IC68_9GAMM|nr:nitroreductase family protein [Legionella maioricensis]MCL9684936.1 nitroreductase family protein [Legionella maioricensis]MCL9688232.1 nitroreductase family protein [Legionella maioricensis]